MSFVQVIPLGGADEIGKNCNVVRQGDDIVVVDCGLSFPSEEMLGVDIVIPDFRYLLANRDKVRGVFITHAHEDHVGGLPYLLRELQVPVFCSPLAAALLRPKLEERVGAKAFDLRIFNPGDIIEAGSLSVEPIRITHSIPETCAMAVRTAQGIVLFTADFKFDFTPVDGKMANITRLGELGREGVIALVSDCTNAEETGWSLSESVVKNGLRNAFANAQGRVLLTTFASNIHRMQQTIDVAAEMGRKVAIAGRRMEQTIEICAKMGYMKLQPGVMIALRDSTQYPAHQLAILTTGTQGEPLSALVQMSKGEYSRLQIQKGDTVLY
ncbi:MAG: ribonuclease J, partial [Nitrospirae bacterium]|nr:ribonuclease J [Fimbriimonadaceae bacterium]